ncbi:serine hydrolase [Hymenobacter sp. 15J16-1T3B]|uniref:serine hydrolase n=1 Tax=Hymenobacter sp. 15J16-1T3B TaxID=2886941 RepID=UPI001D11F804|nr:serine hydrolase [Hymenobacter sp. 15J16-1T3B]MCC3158029.1 serine hydrolase [Hymenobacter sp. 15J16-1T3B]
MLRFASRRLLGALCCTALGGALAASPAAAQPAARPATGSRFVADSLDAYVQRGLRLWQIPGLAVVVVKDGQVVVSKGYGVRAVGRPEPVDGNTQFLIASNSKLFTGTALAQLEQEKKLSLNDPATKYLPDFRLYDPVSTQLVTVRDLLGHHLGTKTFQGDFTFWSSNLSREEILQRVRLLKPSAPFRQDYGYCNAGFLAAGQIIPAVTGGTTWEAYVEQTLLKPLGMSNTSMLTAGVAQHPNVALPYSNAYGPLTALPYDQVDNLGPAASMVSCVNDLGKWLQFQLDSGKVQGRPVLPWATLRRTRDVNTALSARKSPLLPEHFRTYGLGVFAADYNGRQVFWHTGGANGFVSNTCFVPEEGLGIAVLTNQDNQSFFEALRYQLLDAYLGMPYTDRSRQLWKRAAPFQAETKADIEKLNARVAKKAKPELPLKAYAGQYTHPLYGLITIEAQGKQLVVRFSHHPALTAALAYMDGQQFRTTYSNIAYGIFPATFTVEGGQVKAVELRVNDGIEQDPYVFTRG